MKLLAALLGLTLLSSCQSNRTDIRQGHGLESTEDIYKKYNHQKNNASNYTKQDNESNNDEEDESDNESQDGIWCADVEYFNPNTGTDNTYELEVIVENGELVEIEWPNGGWLDETHFISEDISTGECSFTSDRGYEYTVTLNEKGSCGSNDGYRMQREINDDINQERADQNFFDDDKNGEDSDP